MTDSEHELHVCDAAVTLAFSVLGKRWNGMIVSALGSGASTFGALRRAVPGISDAVLSERLAGLAEAGLVVRTVTPGPPTAVAYALSDSGERLLPILDQLGRWASGNLAEQPTA
ncbi:HxlR-like helix-turn-helix family protein [Microbacterium sp. C448]|uniref:winged helix-turn-helix transcriptional regulator n=1 Tax=Microbacterium TaxID=33882 RepID=UPI0003DE137F|nr:MULTISPECIES: helix-turn-helix domain-containing protein [Microbacterium]MDO8382564.1 helix-turn-helix domain-containing protein [Microbacterium sp.]CDK00949.1 HxlR-like helix-turn-helix family protein [Microbacterium sp. C448]|tara:strand:+ start:49 stop:390 length:342 start_codon:yes stop_codon:yes gene_type:complete